MLDMFKGASQDALARVAQHSERRSFAKGETLMRQGEASRYVYVIVTGRVRVDRTHPLLPEPFVLADLGPGEIVGEMGVLDGEARSATVVATEDTETVELGATALAVILLQFPEVSVAILRTFSRRLRKADEMLAQMLRQVRN